MRRIGPKEGEKDGSNRLLAWACRAVEHDLTDDAAIAAIREAERTHPFPAFTVMTTSSNAFATLKAKPFADRPSHQF